MTINQIIAFCLVAVLIAFIVVLARMAVPAIELLKKTKVLVGKSTEAVGDVKTRVEKLSEDALKTVNAVAADTSGAVKTVSVLGVGLTSLGLIKAVLRILTGSGVFADISP